MAYAKETENFNCEQPKLTIRNGTFGNCLRSPRASLQFAGQQGTRPGAYDRNRTGDHFLTKEVLYRLSYIGNTASAAALAFALHFNRPIASARGTGNLCARHWPQGEMKAPSLAGQAT